MDAVAERLIWQWAEREGAVIVTKDEDFALWRMARPRQTPQVLWLRIDNTRRAELLQGMKQLLPQGVDGSAVLGSPLDMMCEGEKCSRFKGGEPPRQAQRLALVSGVAVKSRSCV